MSVPLRSVEPKPKGWGERYGAVFRDQSVVEHYGLRPPYPAETFEVLASLAVDGARLGGTVLDAGCGPGDLARPLAARVSRVDAVDVSEPMIALGRSLPGGEAPTCAGSTRGSRRRRSTLPTRW